MMLARRSVRLILALLLLLVLAALVLATWEPLMADQPGPPPPAKAYRAEIVRDEWGVPHIHGATDADVAYGLGWAHAEDDFSTLQDVMAMARCRYGAIAGESGARLDYVCRLFAPRVLVRNQLPHQPAQTRALLEGYASALNRYAKQHPAEVKLSRLFPVNAEDVATGFAVRIPFFAGIDRTLSRLVAGDPLPPDYGTPLNGRPPLTFAEGGGDQLGAPGEEPVGEGAYSVPPDEPGNGSNAFAVAPQRSADGVTRLISNAHQPWRGPVAWYEVEIRSDEGWHFAGATFPGSPYPFLGHNENLGWTNTLNRPDLADVYKLVLSGDAKNYRLDGKWRKLERETVTLPYKVGPFALPVRKTIARSAHGPVIENPRGAFALRYAGIDNIDAVTEYYRLSKARDFAEWRAALAMVGIPSTNFVYADRTGRIAYVYNGRFPERKAGPDWRGVLPGDRSDLIWTRALPFKKLPQIVDPASGVLFNANNTPLVAAGAGSEIAPASLDPLMGVELDVTNRTRRAARLFAEAPSKISRDDLLRIKFDTGYENAGYVKASLGAIARLDLRGEPDLRKAQALLATWDFSADGKGAADTLAVMILKDAISAAYNHKLPPDPQKALKDAAAHLMKHFGRLDPPLRTAQRIRQGTADEPMDGASDTLRAATSFDLDPKDGRLNTKHGDSYVMLMEWPKDGPVRSRSIVPFGASLRPASPHYSDQAALFARHELKAVWFTPQDVTAHAKSRALVGQ